MATVRNGLLRKAGVPHIHAVELFKRTKQFKGWKAEEANALAVSLDRVIATHLQVGWAVVVRDDDFKGIYRAGPNPRRLPKDTTYGVCFRAVWACVPSYIAYELGALTQEITINFALEHGHKNLGDARRLFAFYKANAFHAAAPAHSFTIKSLSWRFRPGAEKFAAPARSNRPSIW